MYSVDEVEIFANKFVKHSPLAKERDGWKEKLQNKTEKKSKQQLRVRKLSYCILLID
jgi:hypothetical protein